MARNVDGSPSSANRRLCEEVDGEELIQRKSRRSDLLARRPALSSDAEALGEETKPRTADPTICGEEFALVERAAIRGKHSRETLQAIPSDDRTMGEVAQQKSSGSTEG